MTHVNFSALDQFTINAVGIYGSKSEIVRYLRDLDMVNDETYVYTYLGIISAYGRYCRARLLLDGKDDMPDSQTLRTGLYLLRDIPRDIVYVIFWPQDTTWDDDCISSVARNRVTFMRCVGVWTHLCQTAHELLCCRYLTKIADQVVALVSDEHADAIVWRSGDNDGSDSGDENTDSTDDDLDNIDRLYTFKVAKTREEEENVVASLGFKVHV